MKLAVMKAELKLSLDHGCCRASFEIDLVSVSFCNYTFPATDTFDIRRRREAVVIQCRFSPISKSFTNNQ